MISTSITLFFRVLEPHSQISAWIWNRVHCLISFFVFFFVFLFDCSLLLSWRVFLTGSSFRGWAKDSALFGISSFAFGTGIKHRNCKQQSDCCEYLLNWIPSRDRVERKVIYIVALLMGGIGAGRNRNRKTRVERPFARWGISRERPNYLKPYSVGCQCEHYFQQNQLLRKKSSGPKAE